MDTVIVITDGTFTLVSGEIDIIEDGTASDVLEDGTGDTIVNG